MFLIEVVVWVTVNCTISFLFYIEIFSINNTKAL